jgi:hypothetical protein
MPSDGLFTRILRCSVGPSELFRGDRMIAVWNSLYWRQFYTSMRRLFRHCHPGEVSPATLSPTPIYAPASRRANPGHYYAHPQCLDGVGRRSSSHPSLAGANLNVSLRVKLYSRFRHPSLRAFPSMSVMSSASSTLNSVHSGPPSSCTLTRYLRPEDISPMRIVY